MKESKKQNKSFEKELVDWLLGKDLKREPKDEKKNNKEEIVKTQKVDKIKRINGLAITGFILGLASILLSWIGIVPILAIIFSAVGIGQTKKKNERGKELAIIGLILGIIYTIVYLYQYSHLF